MNPPQETYDAVNDVVQTLGTPTNAGVAGALLFGITLEGWVIIGSAALIVLQFALILPKLYRTYRDVFRKKS